MSRDLWNAWPVVVFAAVLGAPALGAEPDVGWPVHGGDPGHEQYSTLRQIDASNVEGLTLAWTYHTGDARSDDRSQIQCNPIVVGSILYATSPGLKAFALDAATGHPLWTFDPFAGGGEPGSLGVNRGVAYWADGDDRRILFTAGPRLYALDARTGKPIPGFGSGGSVDLHDGLGRDVSRLFVISTTPGAVYRDLLILGTRVAEGPGPAAPGYVRAYDVRTGAIRWTFHTIPWPGEAGYETWPSDAWRRVGGANAWSGISVDRQRGLVFLPIGSATFDFWGGDRAGADLYADCVLALDAATGRHVWHFQTVHHDLWDRDPPAAPVLVTVEHDGRKVDAVAQVTKSGFVFLLDRESGRPLFPVEEQPVPSSDLRGELAWPTQPVPLLPPPFARQLFTEQEVTDLSPASHAAVLARLRELRTGRRFIPPSLQGTIIFPGFDGGAEWGGPAFDPTTGRLYVNANEMPWILQMVPVKDAGGSNGARLYRQYCAACHGAAREGAPAQNVPELRGVAERLSKNEIETRIRDGKGVMPGFAYLKEQDRQDLTGFLVGEKAPREDAFDPEKPVGTPYTHTGYNRFLDPDGYPAVKPPWGTLTAIDLNRGEIDWQVPLGELEALTRRGLPPTGTENYGGPVVTAGGVVFIAATKDEKFRAFDAATGKRLWETALPAAGYATPATYAAGGRQYVVIACGGGKLGTKSGDAYVAFALPPE
jgi:quinoprotein glucose dehydrogenase